MSIDYNVVVNLTTRGDLAGSLGGLSARLGTTQYAATSLANTVGGVGKTIADAFTGAVESVAKLGLHLAGVGVAAGVAGLVGSVTHLNSKLEETQISLATIFTANGISNNMSEGLMASSKLMDKMRKDAADLPGEFKDLVNIFQMAAAPGLKAGLSANALEEMSAKVMAAGVATGVSMPMAAREFSMLLAGHAGAHNVLGMKVFGLSGDDAKAFNKMDAQDRIKLLTEGLNKFAPAIEVFKNSWVGLSSTLKDNALRTASIATSGFFERAKGSLKDLNGWFDKNREQINVWASYISEELIKAFDWGKQKVQEWGPAIFTFAKNAFEELRSVWDRIEPIVKRVAGTVKDALNDPTTFDKIEKILAIYGATKGVQMVAPLLPSPSALGGMGTIAGLTGFETLGVSLGILTPVIVAAAGAIDVLTDSNNKLHAGAIQDIKVLKEQAGQLGDSASKLGPPLRELADTIGSLWIFSLTAGITVTNGFVQALGAMVGWLKEVSNTVEAMISQPTTFQVMNDYEHGPAQSLISSVIELDDDVSKTLSKTVPGAGGGGGGTHIQKVEIVVTSNADPSRIARLTVAELANISRHPKSSRGATNFSRSGNG